MGMPKFLETEIRDKILPNRLTPLAFERQSTTKDPVSGGKVTKTLVITDFCSGGDLMQHAALQVSPEDKIKSALTIYTQMAEILIQLKDNNCAFIDMKNTNWLIDDKNFIQIADTKGFVPTRSDGVFDCDSYESRWFRFVSTKYMNPPEFSYSRSFDVDKAHAYMLGKNLYQYLTDNDSFYYAGHEAKYYNFMNPVFTSSPIGKRMEILIKALIKPDPTSRMNVSNALKTLKKIEIDFKEIVDLKAECRRLLNEIKLLDLNASTSQRQAMYQNVEFEIVNRNDRQDLLDLTAVLEKEFTKVGVYVIKVECADLFKQISQYGFSFSSATHNQYLDQMKERIRTENDPGLLIKIKEELIINLGKAQQVDKLRNECDETIDKIKAYGFVGNKVLDDFLSARNTALAFGEINLNALVQMKSELTTALARATIVFDLKSGCHTLIEEIRKLDASIDDPELQASFIKKHAMVDCVFDMNKLKQYKTSLDELLIQMQHRPSAAEIEGANAPSPGQSK